MAKRGKSMVRTIFGSFVSSNVLVELTSSEAKLGLHGALKAYAAKMSTRELHETMMMMKAWQRAARRVPLHLRRVRAPRARARRAVRRTSRASSRDPDDGPPGSPTAASAPPRGRCP